MKYSDKYYKHMHIISAIISDTHRTSESLTQFQRCSVKNKMYLLEFNLDDTMLTDKQNAGSPMISCDTCAKTG